MQFFNNLSINTTSNLIKNKAEGFFFFFQNEGIRPELICNIYFLICIKELEFPILKI